ncbi:uncharacterized protein At4g38062-like [Papaver somniferum]|uniref:uncharacterized protein At4g38062-like n=1 Tax=Papaver somniferum TaxID=3469 RepID=UPI000E6F4E25|nr:uncharacterized protein At4g38062-like [Papaver somniferum]XP_026456835.1 uncharacterized protein At4g38062-like [Papaver somniferum]
MEDMEKLIKELDDAKGKIEKLEAECQTKEDLSERLKRARDEQVAKIREANLEIDKQARELSAKTADFLDTKQMYEDIKNSMDEKESAVKHLRAVNEKLRSDYEEKLEKLEGDTRKLLVALDESNMKSEEQEQKVNSFKEEIAGLKELLNVTKKKCSEAEQRANGSKDLRKREDMCIQLEEENSKFKDQLKWKMEQFEHLQEAHNKIQDEFRLSKKEWAKEKSNLIDEISSSQTSLNSQIRISESLQSRLEMCNQALAHEESRRKLLEVQLSESKQSYENVFADYQEANSKVDILTAQRDEEIASLRNSLGTKQTLSKEMEFRIGQLEEENRELRGSLKEFQEARIQDAGAASSLLKIRNKLKGLEQVHKECSVNLKARESELALEEKQVQDLQMELEHTTSKILHLKLNNEEMSVLLNKLSGLEQVHKECSVHLKARESELDLKEKQIQDLQMELEQCNMTILQLKLDNEEMSVLLMVYKSGFSDAQSNLSNSKAATELCDFEKEEQIARLMEQLDEKNSSLEKAYAEMEECRQTVTSLEKKIESLNASNMSNSKVEMELHSKEKDEKIADLIGQLEEKKNSLLKAYDEIEKYRDIASSLEKKSELLEVSEQKHSAMQTELERYKRMLEESTEKCCDITSSLAKKSELLEVFEQQYSATKTELESYKRMLEESTEKCCDVTSSLEKKIELLEVSEQQYSAMQKELERYKEMIEELNTELAERTNEESEAEFELERWKSVAERLQVCLEENQEIRREMETSLLAQIEMEQILKQEKENLEAALEVKHSEFEEVRDQLGNKERTLEGVIEKLETDKILLGDEILKLTSEKKEFLDLLGDFSGRVSGFSDKDTELMARLESTMQSINKANELVTDLIENDDNEEVYDLNIENVNTLHTRSAKNVEFDLEGRSPLKERNISC